MFKDVIFLSVLIAVLFLFWIALNINIRVRRKRTREIKNVNFSGYIVFVKQFKLAEEAEASGDTKIALEHFNKALASLEEEENPDTLIRETIDEVKTRISALEK